MIRYSTTDLPPVGTLVKLKPIKYLTVALITKDSNHPYFSKATEGVVLDTEDYQREEHYLTDIHHVVPIETKNGRILLVPPDFLTSKLKPTIGKSILQSFIDKIKHRVEELTI